MSADRQPPTGAGKPLPFLNSRLKQYNAKLDSSIDPKVTISSSMALAPDAELFTSNSDPNLSVEQRTNSDSQQRTGGDFSFAAKPKTAPPAGGCQGAQAQLLILQQDDRASTASYSFGSPAVRSPMGTAHGHGAPAMNASAQVSAAELAALKAEIAGIESVLGYLKGSEAITTLGRKAAKLPSHEQLKRRTQALVRSSSPTRAQGGASSPDSPDRRAKTLPAMQTGLMMQMRKSVSPQGRGRSADAEMQSNLSDSGFEVVVKDPMRPPKAWRTQAAPQPIGRGEALILEAALDEALPAGSILAKYSPNRGGLAGTSGAADLYLASQSMAKDHDMLDMVAREAARQVSSHCQERGKLLVKVADRYLEFFNGMGRLAAALHQHNARLEEQMAAAGKHMGAQSKEVAGLQSQLHGKDQEIIGLRDQLAALHAKLEHAEWDASEQLEKLQGQNQVLAAEAEHYQDLLMQAGVERENALAQGLSRLEGDLEAVRDERDDLAQRIRFLERQIVDLRQQLHKAPVLVNTRVQTDPVEWASGGQDTMDEEDGQGLDGAASVEQSGAPSPSPLTKVKRGKGKRGLRLGGFEGLISLQGRVGRVRGMQWTNSCISQVYYDKVLADAVADREGNPRTPVCQFTYDWHLTRYGLKNLAEINLLDLIASVRHHYKSSQRLRWFAVFCGLVEMGAPHAFDNVQALSFYLFVLQQLAFPNSITALFPDLDDTPVLIKATVLAEVVRSVFRYLNDADLADRFLARSIEPLLDPEGATANADTLVRVLMDEYLKRVERNVAHLKALFRAGDVEGRGFLGYDNFVMLLRYAAPDISERLVTKMYSEAMRGLPAGQYLINIDTFVNVARDFGLDRWKIEATGIPTLPSPMQSRPSSTYSHPAAGAGAVVGTGGRRESTPSVSGNLGINASALLRMLDSALEALDPSLETQLAAARERLGPASPATARLEAQLRHFNEVYSSREDANTCWLAFRMLCVSLVQTTQRPITSREGSRSPTGKGGGRTKVLPSGSWRAGMVGAPPVTSGMTSQPSESQLPGSPGSNSRPSSRPSSTMSPPPSRGNLYDPRYSQAGTEPRYSQGGIMAVADAPAGARGLRLNSPPRAGSQELSPGMGPWSSRAFGAANHSDSRGPGGLTDQQQGSLSRTGSPSRVSFHTRPGEQF